MKPELVKELIVIEVQLNSPRFYHFLSQRPVKCNKHGYKTSMLITKDIKEVNNRTMRTSPPPRISGIDSAWMSVGNLMKQNKSIIR